MPLFLLFGRWSVWHILGHLILWLATLLLAAWAARKVGTWAIVGVGLAFVFHVGAVFLLAIYDVVNRSIRTEMPSQDRLYESHYEPPDRYTQSYIPPAPPR